MSAAHLKASILANAQEIQRLTAHVQETSKLRDRSPEDHRNWQRACEAFHSNYDALAFPGGYADALERIASSQPEAVESALCFLEARPYFFRSGYMFKDILRKTKRAALTEQQTARLAVIVAAYEQYRTQRQQATGA